jgi:HK97 family phage portal protein
VSVVVSGGQPTLAVKAGPGDWRSTEGYVSGGQRGIPLLDRAGTTLTYEGMVRTQPTLFAVVSKLHRGIARLPLHAYTELPEAGRERDRGSTLSRLLRRPFPRGTPFELKQRIAGDLLVHSNAMVAKIRPSLGAAPTELWPVPWRHVTVQKQGGEIVAYKVYVDGDTWTFAPRDVIHFRDLDGVSRLEPLRRTLSLEDAALTHSTEMFRNGLSMRGAFTVKEKVRNAEDFTKLRQDLEQLYAGPGNAGRFGLFDAGLEWMPIQQSAVDAELIGQRKLSREEVCSVFDVSPPLVGFLERATFNNVEELHKAFYVDTLGPWITMIEETIQAQLVDDEPSWDGLFVEFLVDELVRPDLEARARAHMTLMQAGVTTVNERRRLENLPPIAHELADTVLLPTNMAPAGDTPLPTMEPASDAAVRAITSGDLAGTLDVKEGTE